MVDGINSSQETPLMKASMKGNTEIVKLLVSSGANVNAANKDGITSLITASNFGHTETVQFLLENKAQVNATNREGLTPLIVSSRRGHREVVTLLVQNSASLEMADNIYGNNPLLCATWGNHPDIIHYLIDQGSNVNVQNFQASRRYLSNCCSVIKL